MIQSTGSWKCIVFMWAFLSLGISVTTLKYLRQSLLLKHQNLSCTSITINLRWQVNTSVVAYSYQYDLYITYCTSRSVIGNTGNVTKDQLELYNWEMRNTIVKFRECLIRFFLCNGLEKKWELFNEFLIRTTYPW